MAKESGVRLGAALFNADHGHLADEVARVEAAGIDFLHLDVFDGMFVPDLGFPVRTIEAIRPLTDMPFEVHLAAEDPLRFVPQLAHAGVDTVIVHVESLTMAYESLFTMRELGVKVGLVFTLGTSLVLLEPVVGMIDALLLLARVTGEGARGASFNPLVVPRVDQARSMIDREGAEVDLQVAGGLNRQHVRTLVDAGAMTLALGSGLYKVDDMAEEVRTLRALAEGGS